MAISAPPTVSARPGKTATGIGRAGGIKKSSRWHDSAENVLKICRVYGKKPTRTASFASSVDGRLIALDRHKERNADMIIVKLVAEEGSLGGNHTIVINI